MNKLERQFQREVIKEIKTRIPGSVVEKWSVKQGYPDLLILHNKRWATLECKKSIKAKYQPNQERYIEKFNRMSFSRMICPENREEIIDELQQTLQT